MVTALKNRRLPMSKSSQESSPITQWREKAKETLEAVSKGDSPEAVMNYITSATIELIEGLIEDYNYADVCPDCKGIGSDDNANFFCDRCRAEGWIWLKNELRQSLKELSE
jgi:hypothetical protein